MKNFIGVVVALSILISGCTPQYTRLSGHAQGTTYHIIYKNTVSYQSAIDSILQSIDMSLSRYIESSLLTRLNNNDSTAQADDNFTAVFKRGQEISAETGGAFDMTVAPLVNAWGFGFNEPEALHDSIVQQLLQYVGYKKVQLVNKKLVKQMPEIKIDVDAIAQGYTVDVIANMLEINGIKDYMVEVGGEVRTSGRNEQGEGWHIAIDKPIEGTDETNRQIQAVLAISDRSMATSGNYRRYFVENGVKYSHTIDPTTGYPARHNLLSTTVIANDCASADAYATACMAMGLEKAKKFIESRPDLEAYFVYSGDKGEFLVYNTEGLKKMLVE